ncbi:mitochondrial carrier [Marasmius fiardii PR-910]|nr:mitochondrial carrier [Marasmius fiardii PR-910]
MGANTRHSQTQTNHDVYDKTLAGAIDPPLLPKLRLDKDLPQQMPLPRSLAEFREEEGREIRKRRLRALWNHICEHGYLTGSHARTSRKADLEGAEKLRLEYEHELLGRCVGSSGSSSSSSGTMSTHKYIEWKEFKAYAEAKEVELWGIFHDELDLDGNGRLDANELDMALRRSGIKLSQATLSEFMTFLTSSPHSRPITFAEFRDFLLLLPRKISPAEIYRYYQLTKFLGDDGRGAARVTMEGDVSLSAEDKPPPPTLMPTRALTADSATQARPQNEGHEDGEEGDDIQSFLDHHTALKFLLAGGIAGAVSRTATAPFDRLKIFLITRPSDVGNVGNTMGGVRVIGAAIARIYTEGGLLGFWVGNGLSVAKIFPESAIKFFAYESSKRAFARYWDGVDDPRNISGLSRFLSGGIGGITSQLSIYPIETLKTQMMSITGQKRTLMDAARHLWGLGGMRAYYRGLTIGLLGVFPYSAIDMSTFEALKLTYLRSTGKEEPGVLALLAFGSISGSVGATSVYPMNLVRTRLQASGSPGHPQKYTGPWDVAVKTFEKEGWKGFYRGLVPTLAKVVPSVSISYVVYEHSKRRLGVSS